jgi:molybdopterin-guanine dinucleotide biosynthesis protein A
MKLPCSGVILAGGLNKRFSGVNKAFFRVNGTMVFDSVYGLFKELFGEIILVTNDPIPFLKWDLQIVTDMFPIKSPLIGIHAGLFYSSLHHAFVAACDTPFLKSELVEAIVDEIDNVSDVVIPETADGLQPLCAVYTKAFLSALKPHLAKQAARPKDRELIQKELKIQYLFKKVRVKKLSEKLLREKDPDLISFFNVNTPDDLARANEMARNLANGGLKRW